MGYCIQVTNSKITIEESNKQKALKAVRALRGKETIRDSSGRHWSWVDNNKFNNAGTLEDMFRVWRWSPKTDPETGNITSICFEGEKMGDDGLLFSTLAPFIEADSYIEFLGEDGARWRYNFDGRRMKEVKGKTVWEEE